MPCHACRILEFLNIFSAKRQATCEWTDNIRRYLGRRCTCRKCTPPTLLLAVDRFQVVRILTQQPSFAAAACETRLQQLWHAHVNLTDRGGEKLKDATILPTRIHSTNNKLISLASGTAATEFGHFPLVCATRGTNVARRPWETSRACITCCFVNMYPRVLQQSYILLFHPASWLVHHLAVADFKVTPRQRGEYCNHCQITSNRQITYSNIPRQTS